MNFVRARTYPDQIAAAAAAYSPDGTQLVVIGGTSDQPGQICVWNADDSPSSLLSSKSRSLHSLCFSPDSGVCATAGANTRFIELYQLTPLALKASKELLREPFRKSIAGHFIESTKVSAMQFSPSGLLLAAGCWDCSVKIMEVDSNALLEHFVPSKHNVDFVAFLDSPERLIAGTYQHLYQWNTSTWEMKPIPLDAADFWTHVHVPQGKIFSIAASGKVLVWNTDTWIPTVYHLHKQDRITSVAASSFCRLIAIAGADGAISLLDIESLNCVGVVQRSGERVSSMSFSPRERLLCVTSGSRKGRVTEWILD
jgi:WD40 repeat protein